LDPNPTNGMVVISLESFPVGNPMKITLSSLQGATIKELFDGIFNEPIFMFNKVDFLLSVNCITIHVSS